MMIGDEDGLFYAPILLMSRAGMRRAWKERPFSTFVATGGGAGMIPLAPGTWGSFEGLALAALLARAAFVRPSAIGKLLPFASPAGVGFLLVAVAAIVALAAGTIASGRAEESSGERDPGAIVVDEIAGQLIAAAPCALLGARAGLWVLSFALFRVFDIWKPGPIDRLQRLPGGRGIMADDVAAGVVAGAIVYGVGRLGWL